MKPCPACGSRNIRPIGWKGTSRDGLKDECGDCGHQFLHGEGSMTAEMLADYHDLTVPELNAAIEAVRRMDMAFRAPPAVNGGNTRSYGGRTGEAAIAKVAPHWRRQVKIMSVACAMYREAYAAGLVAQPTRQKLVERQRRTA